MTHSDQSPSKSGMSGDLSGIKVFYDNRIKVGTLLPTKDGRNYRANKETLKMIKNTVDSLSIRDYVRKAQMRDYYMPKILKPTKRYII